MGTDEYLRGLSGADSSRKTRNVNVFDQTERKIKCIEKTHDYLGDGNPITEEDLEIGKLYTFIVILLSLQKTFRVRLIS